MAALECPEHLQFAGHCWHKLSVAFAGLVSLGIVGILGGALLSAIHGATMLLAHSSLPFGCVATFNLLKSALLVSPLQTDDLSETREL